MELIFMVMNGMSWGLAAPGLETEMREMQGWVDMKYNAKG
jgi:hypothetical protein